MTNTLACHVTELVTVVKKFYSFHPVAQKLEIELATHLVKKQLKQAA
jgi:hypothetical protein